MKIDISGQYELFRSTDIGETASALLTLATIIQENVDFKSNDLSHNICLGIRKGLFGAAAGDNSSLIDLKNK